MGWNERKIKISGGIQEGGVTVQFLILAVATATYMIHAGYMDIREKKIYSFPCQVLTVIWTVFLLWGSDKDIRLLIGYWIIQISLYIFFHHFRIWGAGDSDIFLLFGNVYFVTVGSANVYAVALGECICLAIALCISLGSGWAECKIRKEVFDIKGKAAVVPGFSVVVLLLLMHGIVGGVSS